MSIVYLIHNLASNVISCGIVMLGSLRLHIHEGSCRFLSWFLFYVTVISPASISHCLLIIPLPCHFSIYYIDTSVLLENTPLVQFIRNHIRDSSGVFSMFSIVKISIISLISICLLNCTEICWCIIETSSGLPRKSSAIFGNPRKFSENVQQRSCDLRASFGEYSEIFGKSSKTPSSVCLYNKKNITR